MGLLEAQAADLVRDVEGWLSDRECELLHEVAQRSDDQVLLEVGAWKGKSTICLASGLLERSFLYTIDPFKDNGEPGASVRDQFLGNLRRKKVCHKVNVCVGFSRDVADQIPAHINTLFIDGDHSIYGCAKDYELFAHRLRPGGLILFHDYVPSRLELGPTWVIKRWAEKEFELVKIVDTTWVGRRV